MILNCHRFTCYKPAKFSDRRKLNDNHLKEKSHGLMKKGNIDKQTTGSVIDVSAIANSFQRHHYYLMFTIPV